MNWLRSLLMPAPGSAYASEVDDLFLLILAISAFFFLLIAGSLSYFVWRYRRRRPDEITPHISHNFKLEVAWAVIPLIIVVILFFLGFNSYMNARIGPGEALEIQVRGKRWVWEFEYPDGMRTVNEIYIPVNRPVRFIMTSEDVIHSFYVPSFRVKMDVLPNRYTSLWFHPVEEGVHTMLCAEYCGRGHSDMLARIHVVSEEKYREWQEQGDVRLGSMPLAELGRLLYDSHGCATCHSLDGSRREGPSLKGIFGATHAMRDGSSVVVDENYLRESILEPQARIVAGYEAIMPTYQGLLRERELAALIEFIKTQK